MLHVGCAQVTQWFDVVVFTASMEVYGAAVTDKLETHAHFFKGRYFRHVRCVLSLLSFISAYRYVQYIRCILIRRYIRFSALSSLVALHSAKQSVPQGLERRASRPLLCLHHRQLASGLQEFSRYSKYSTSTVPVCESSPVVLIPYVLLLVLLQISLSSTRIELVFLKQIHCVSCFRLAVCLID